MKEKYDRIGENYNQTRQADPYLLSRLRFYLGPLEGPVLDIGCGTGNYTIALQEAAYQMEGVDPSSLMLEVARSKSKAIKWTNAKVEDLPFEANKFRGATVFLSLHHWQSLEIGFKEVRRVLTPGGPLIIFSSTPEQMRHYWLRHYFPAMIEASCQQMPSLERVKEALSDAGLDYEGVETYAVREDLQDHFLACGKHQPELYLKPEIRAGISSFAAIAHEDEVRMGLQKLKRDIERGEVHNVIRTFEHDGGDYLFIRARA